MGTTGPLAGCYVIDLTDDGYEAVVTTGDGGTLRLDQHGRVWE